jgi:signal transduction histidine kinase
VPGNIAEILYRAARSCGPLAEPKKVAIEVRAPDRTTAVRRDPDRLEQVFQNLLANAIHFTLPGTTVTVAARDVGEPRPGVLCEVLDQGPGLSTEALAHVFEPFFTQRRGGTGLGLSIVQRLVEAHRGTIEAGNRVSGGAFFRVFLPAAEDAGEEGT